MAPPTRPAPAPAKPGSTASASAPALAPPPRTPHPPPAIHTAADLHHHRHLSQARLKRTWESIFTRFSHNFDGIADEIDGATGAVLVDNGHLRSLADAPSTTTTTTTTTSPSSSSSFSACAQCADRDELDSTPCRHRPLPTREQLLQWAPARLTAHFVDATARLGAPVDSCDLSFQMEKHDISGRAVGALTLRGLKGVLRLHDAEVVAAIWEEVRRLQGVLEAEEELEEEEEEELEEEEEDEEGDKDEEGEDVWAPPPREDDPFYSAAWRDEHPDGTPATFRGKRRREEVVGAPGRKRVKVVRVGTPKAGGTKSVVTAPRTTGTTETPSARRTSTFEVAIPARRPAPPAAKTPGPTSTTKETPGTASKPAPAATPEKPASKTPGPKCATKDPPATTRSKSPPAKPTPAATPAGPPSTKKAPGTAPKPAPSRPALKTPTSTPRPTPPPLKTPRPKPSTARKRTPGTKAPATPGWTASVDRRKLRGQSFARFAADNDGEDELSSPGPGQRRRRGSGKRGELGVVEVEGGEKVEMEERGGVKEAGGETAVGDSAPNGVVAPPVALEAGAADTADPALPQAPAPEAVPEPALEKPTPTPAPAETPAPQKAKAKPHTCTKKGFCFVCLDLEGSEDDLI